MSSIFYVYLLLDPRQDYAPFYVGKGHGRRGPSHLWPCYYMRRDTPTNRAIRAIVAEGLTPKLIYWRNNLTEDEAYALEINLIGRFGRQGVDPEGILTNATTGGEGLAGHRFSSDHKNKIKAALKGQKRSEETREKIRKIRLGTKASEITRQKMSASRKGRYTGKENSMYGRSCSEETLRRMSAAQSGANNAMFGRRHTPESIEKMRQSIRARQRRD